MLWNEIRCVDNMLVQIFSLFSPNAQDCLCSTHGLLRSMWWTPTNHQCAYHSSGGVSSHLVRRLKDALIRARRQREISKTRGHESNALTTTGFDSSRDFSWRLKIVFLTAKQRCDLSDDCQCTIRSFDQQLFSIRLQIFTELRCLDSFRALTEIYSWWMWIERSAESDNNPFYGHCVRGRQADSTGWHWLCL